MISRLAAAFDLVDRVLDSGVMFRRRATPNGHDRIVLGQKEGILDAPLRACGNELALQLPAFAIVGATESSHVEDAGHRYFFGFWKMWTAMLWTASAASIIASGRVG